MYTESEDFKTLTDAYNSKFEEYWPTLSKPAETKKAYGFFLAGKLSSFKDIGGFDFTRFKPCFAEDDDFSVRLKIKGYSVYLSPDCFVYHLSAKTSKNFKRQGQERASLCEFVRKWGFDPKFLYETKFEYQNWLRLKDFHVQFIIASQQDLELLKYIEPAMTSIVGSTEELTVAVKQMIQTLEPDKPWLTDKTELDGKSNPDIQITVAYPDKLDRITLFKALFQMRFATKPLKTGTYIIGGFKVVIVDSLESNSLLNDSVNYLLLQSQLHYEQ